MQWRKSVRMGLVAASVQGGWALFVNRAHDEQWLAALVQAGCSFAVTFMLTWCIVGLVSCWARVSPVLRWLSVFVAVTAGMGALQVGAHWLAGTPRLLLTVTLPLTIGGMYCAVFSAVEVRQQQQQAPP